MKPSEIDVLSKEYVIEHGTEFDGEEICWGGDYGDLVCSSEGVPSFFTCPHCRAILKNFNILSNVEGF